MKISRLALVAILAAAQPLAALAQQTPPPDKKDPPLVYGPKLHNSPEQEAAAMRAVAERNRKAWQDNPATRKLAPRRPTRQDIITMPPSPYSTSGYVPMPVPAPSVGVTPIVPSPPVPVDCIGATCLRAGGLPLPPPVGHTTIDANGRQCVQNGNFVQCF
ncbi:MAG TPA: hypothetical protein VGE60_12370 [Telluria sp.]